MERTIKHLAIQYNWESIYDKVKKPRTVVMGSFNPYHPHMNTSPQFYYCRIPSRGRGNQFWRSIARNLNLDEKHFLQNESERLRVMNEYGFVLFDFIDELHIVAENVDKLDKFIEERVLKKFDDGIVWGNKTRGVYVRRTYNQRLIDFMSNTPTIELAVNTLGTGRGHLNFNVTELDWQKFKTDLFEASSKNNVTMDLNSWSPSPQGVGADIQGFDRWIKSTLLR